MINSLFMLGSCYNRDRRISILFVIGWIAYMCANNNFLLSGVFPIVNAIIFLAVSIGINLIKNKKLNTVLSISSILIWSIITDTICYNMYPTMNMGQSLFTYIWQGIIFNYKYIFYNIIAICLINAVIWIVNNIELKIKSAINYNMN